VSSAPRHPDTPTPRHLDTLFSKTVENHVGAVLAKLSLADSPDENRRVLAVLAFLRDGTRGDDS
jgi:hypothetical protein